MATAVAGPTLEQILWSALDRVPEPPALVDCAEFADRIAGAFVADTPSERWVDRFFEGNPELRERAPSDMAQAIVQASRKRMHVYEFDLGRLEYVVLEEEKQVVVVSDLGQFALPKDDRVTQAIDAAVVSPDRARRAFARTEPSALLVKHDGRLVALDPSRMARALAHLDLQQTSLPAVARPPARLEPFQPRKQELTREREALALRENDPRTRRPLVEPSSAAASGAPPEPAVLVALPDGSLPQPEIGAASRWRRMVSDWSQRASLLAPDSSLPAALRTELAFGRGVAMTSARPVLGAVGSRTEARSAALIAARSDLAPIGVLADDDLARAVAAGAGFVPALGAPGVPARSVDLFWIQPELVFATEDRGFADSGEIPLTTRREWTSGGSQVLAARAPDGTLVRVPDAGPPLQPPSKDGRESAAELRSGDGAVRADDIVPVAQAETPGRFGRASRALAARSGAIPAPALATLQLALERTASAGAYKLPPLRTLSAPDAVDAGARMSLPASDPRRGGVRLAGGAVLSGPVARLVLSMPFPTGSTVHVGGDLSDALSALLSMPLAPAAAGRSPGEHSPTTGFQGPRESPAEPGAGAFALPDLLRRAALGASVAPDTQLADVARSRSSGVALSEELVGPPPPRENAAPARPLGLGEEEIVIPLPLWAQMGRERLSSRSQVLSPPAPALGYEPPLGTYRLVVPSALPAVPNEDENPVARNVRLVGPTAVELVSGAGRFEAQRAGGGQLLANAPVERGFSSLPWDERAEVPPADGPLVRQGRIGAPLHPDAARAMRSRAPAEPAQELAISPTRSSPADRASPAASHPPSVASGGVPGTRSSGVVATPGEQAIASGPFGTSSSAAASRRGFTTWASPDVAKPVQTVSFADVAVVDPAWQPALPAGLRFRYAGSPLWWSRSLRREDHAAPEGEEPRSARSGLFAGSSAAAMWRSILVSGAGEGPVTGVDAGWDGRAGELAAAGARGDAMAAAALARGAATASSRAPKTAGPETVYVAIDEQGRAGPMLESRMVSATQQKIDALQMSIVAAIPPAPPPLETMGAPAAAQGRAQAHPRRRPNQQDDEDDDAVSHSKIEGSVDAVAQRIYHRIRRRIESDRERFGG